MKFRAAYVLVFVVAVGLLLISGYYRRSEADAPGWLYLVVAGVVPLAIWMDVKHRRRKGE